MKSLTFFSLCVALLIGMNQQADAQSKVVFDKKTVYQIAEQDFAKHQKALRGERDKPEPGDKPLEKSAAESNLSKSKEAESEMHAAINPLDSNNIIVATMQYSPEGGNPLVSPISLKIFIYYTKDGGQSWSTSSFSPLSSTFFSWLYAGGDPVIAFDSQGRAYLSYLSVEFTLLEFRFAAKLSYAQSNNGGESWTPKGLIDAVTFLSFTDTNRKIVDKEWIATDLSKSSTHQGNLYCAYTELDIADTSYNIYVKRKPAAVDTFERIRRSVTKGQLVFAQFVTIGVDPKGVLHVVFAGAEPYDQILHLFHCRSADGGLNFSNPKKLLGIAIPCFPPVPGEECTVKGFVTERIYPCPSLTIDPSSGASGGNLYITWSGLDIYGSNTADQSMDIFLLRSSDGGNTWSSPRKVNTDKAQGVEQFYPSAYVNPKGILVVSWYDRREDPGNQSGRYYLSNSCDGGISFSPEIPVSGQGMDFVAAGLLNDNFGVGEYTQVVATGSKAFPFWADGRSNDGNLEVMSSKVNLACNRAVAVQEVQNLSSALRLERVFPNPMQTALNLAVETMAAGEVEIKLIGMDGRVLQTQATAVGQGKQLLKVNTSTLSTGAYWVELRFEGARVARLVVKGG